MNPGSVFGSGFGQPQASSPFGTAVGSSSGTASTGFGGSIGSTSSGSSSQVFGSVSTANTAFGTVGGSPGFGSNPPAATGFGSATPGSDSRSAGFGNPSSGGVFGSSPSGFGSSSSTQVFGTSTPGFGTGAVSQNVGFGLSGTNVPGFGAPSGFGTGTTAGSAMDSGTESTRSQFGTGFGRSSAFGASAISTTSSIPDSASKGSGDKGPTFGTGGSGFGGGATAFGKGSSGFGTSSSGFGSSGFGASTPGFSTGSSGFRSGSTSFGSNTPGFGTSSSATSGTSGFGTTAAGGFSGGSSVFGSLTGAQNTPVTSSTTQPQSSSVFGGSTVFGAKTNTSGKIGQDFTSGSGATTSIQTGSSVFGSKSSSNFQGSAGGTTSIFSQIPSSTALVGSAAKSSVFGSSTVSSSTSATPTFGTGSVFGGAQTASVFGASRTATETGQKSSAHSSAGSISPGRAPPPSYSASISTCQPSVFASSSAGSVFGGSSKPSSAGGSVFGVAGGTVIKQEMSQQSVPQAPAVVGTPGNVSQPPPPAYTSSNVFGTAQTRKETNSAATSAQPPSSASVFGGKSDFTSTFGGARQQQGASEHTSLLFGGKKSSEGKESVPQQAVFPAAVTMVGADQKIKTESQKHGTEGQDLKSTVSRRLISRRLGAEGTTTGSVFGGKKEGSSTAGSVFGSPQKRSATGDGEGGTNLKRGRTEEQRQEGPQAGHSQGHPSTSHTHEKVKLHRSSSVLEDISSKTSICCKGISAHLNKGTFLRSQFSRFGKVKQVRPVPAKRYAIIQFETHEAASKAKKHGLELPGQDSPVSIFWKTSTSEKSPVATEEGAQTGRFSWKRSEQIEAKTGRAGERSLLRKYDLPSSVAAELASMSGADSDFGGIKQKRSVERPTSGDRSPRKALSSRQKEPTQRARSRTPPPSSSASNSPISSTSSLAKTTSVTVSSLRKMVATTTMDKFSVLDLRDKLMRQKLGKQSSGSVHAQAFVGTCPDMCPEKERVYREEVRRLSIYEIIPGSSTMTGSTSLVDHMRAVKEYSRSSADQDEPLPHELRPLPVLTLTMNYLLVEIADCGEDGKWAEWYDFLWNRTRSIRKEITQQQLCSQAVVDLLEKCVRFHVYCSERLCTEDMMVFDSKINDENLTKCLQTLKELYADMENKYGLYCPNEAEFRAYIVLMNLNEGDTLREVQQLRPDVRASAEIGFAVKAYSALNSNNYVRFFRLVKIAPFLNACILHRYFNQIRARALQIILKSHTAGQKKAGFAVSELQRLLVFEDDGEVREFCAYYGLRAQGSDLLLDRAAYVEPESSIPSWRAVGLVESKRAMSVGEVINGGPLQPVNLPTPQCSFDEQGRFIGSLEGLDRDESPEKVKPFTVKTTIKPPQLQPSPLQQVDTVDVSATPTKEPAASTDVADANKQLTRASNEVLKTIARDLFFDVIEEHVRHIAESVVHVTQLFRLCEGDILSSITTSVVSDVARQVSTEVMDTEQARQNQLVAAEKREREMRVMEDLVVSVIDSTVEDQVNEVVNEEIEEAKAEEEAERRELCTMVLQSELLQEVTGEMALQVADEVHQVDVVARLQLLHDLQKAVELRRTSQWLAVWRKALKIRQRQKRAMLDFPCAPPMKSAGQRLHSMNPDRPTHVSPLMPGKAALLVNNRAQITLLSPLESEQRSLALTAHLSLASVFNSLQRTRAWQPLNLASLLRTPLNQSVQQWPSRFVKEYSPLSMQWKLLLSLPDQKEMEDRDTNSDDNMTGVYTHRCLMPILKQWLCVKFTHGDGGVSGSPNSSKRNILSQYSIEVASTAVTPPRLRVGICVRDVPEFGRTEKGKQPSKEQGLSITKGTSAILFLLPHADTSDDAIWLASKLRLGRLLKAKPFLPATPVVLLLPCALDSHVSSDSMTTDVTGCLGIQEFQDQGLVSDVAVVELAIRSGQPPDVAIATPLVQTQLSEAVKFLASRVPEPPDLRRERLGDIVEDMLTQHFFTPVLQDLKCRRHLNKLHQAPNTLIGLYNSVLDHILLALTSTALQDISWPAPELQHAAGTREDWNSKKHLADVYELVSSLRLPWFHYKNAAATEWTQVCHDVWTFVDTVVKKRCDSAVSLTTRISRMLAHTCLEFENVCSLTQNEDHCTPTYVNAPWTDIVLACADFRLQRLHNWKEEEEDIGGDLEVFFEEEDLDEFEPPASWLQALLDTEDTESQRIEDTVEQASIIHYARQPAVEDNFTNNSAHYNTNNVRSSDDEAEDSSSSRSASPTEKDMAPPPSHNELPDNVRTALEASENLLMHVGEERQKAQAFERYLEKALRGDTSLDMDFPSILSSPSMAQAVLTPGLPSTTPCRPPSAIRHRGAVASWSTPRVPGKRQSDRSFQPGLEPRRLTVPSPVYQRARIAEVEDSEAVRWYQELPLSQGVDRFKEELQAQRYANELFEKRLQSLLES